MCEVWGAVTQPDVEAHKLSLIELFFFFALLDFNFILNTLRQSFKRGIKQPSLVWDLAE